MAELKSAPDVRPACVVSTRALWYLLLFAECYHRRILGRKFPRPSHAGWIEFPCNFTTRRFHGDETCA
ncbi:hypothetical protein P3T22_003173 [Paraburkholderia sp. GAS348]